MDIDYDNLSESLEQDETDLFNESELYSDDKEYYDESEVENDEQIADNLEIYLKSIEDKLIQGKIDDYTFALENLLVRFEEAIKSDIIEGVFDAGPSVTMVFVFILDIRRIPY